MALIRDRLVNGKRVKCKHCDRTHQIRVSDIGVPFESGEDLFSNPYRHSRAMFESGFVVTGYDYDGWLIAATRYMYQKNRGQVNYTQYLAVCPRCRRDSTEYECTPSAATNIPLEKAQILFNKMESHVLENPDQVYRVYDTQATSVILDDRPVDLSNEEYDEDEGEGNNTRFSVGDNVNFVLNGQQMVGVIEDVDENDLYGVRSNGDYHVVMLVANMMRLFDVDNEELPPEPTVRPFRTGDLVVIMNSSDNVGDIRVTHDIGVITYAPVVDGSLTVRLLRTGIVYSFRRTDIAYLENIRSNILVGDIVTHNADRSNDVLITYEVLSISRNYATVRNLETRVQPIYHLDDLSIVCYGGFEETPIATPEPTQRPQRVSQATAPPTQEAPPREVTDIWIHHKVKSL